MVLYSYLLLNFHTIIDLPRTQCLGLGTKYPNLKAKHIRLDLLILLPNLVNPVWLVLDKYVAAIQ